MDERETEERMEDVQELWEHGDSLERFLLESPSLENAMGAFDGFHTAGIFGGLLTVPELHGNCYRLEVLSHLALAIGSTAKKPSKSCIASWFQELSAGTCRLMEDPPEDAFVTVVTTSYGSFRVFRGIWESAGFYLQRLINVVEEMPNQGDFVTIKSSTRALLQLSESICERADLRRYEFGQRRPADRIPKSVIENLNNLRKRVTFTRSELQRLAIDCNDLRPFILDQTSQGKIRRSPLDDSPLVHCPLVELNGQFVVALPTAISVAIRLFILNSAIRLGRRKTIRKAIGFEYARYFAANPPFETPRGAHPEFCESELGYEAGYGLEVDAGRFVQFIFLADPLDDVERTGLRRGTRSGITSTLLSERVDDFRRRVSQDSELREGLTVLIGCGIGRPQFCDLTNVGSDGWRVTCLGAADVETFGQLRHVTPLTLFRLLDARSELKSRNVQFLNLNGLLNLVGWMRSLDGHLVPHGQVPNEARRSLTIFLDSSFTFDIRRQAAERADRHSVRDVSGQWVEVRRMDSSIFDDDRARPLYVGADWDEEGCARPLLYEGADRDWWCRVPRRHGYERWKLMSTWLPRIAEVIDKELPMLPKRLLISVDFNDHETSEDFAECSTSFERIKAGISVRVIRECQTIEVVTNGQFDAGLSHSENISEAALVEAIIDGLQSFVDEMFRKSAESLRKAIVRGVHARDLHIFRACDFRDHIRHSLPQTAIVLDEADDALLRLGLGWRVPQSGSGILTDKSDCNAFLNAVVALLESDLFAQLRRFDRRAVLELALINHETAIRERSRWRRTSAAVLALHDDREGAIKELSEYESKLNAALLASRIIAEVSHSESPLTGASAIGELDFLRMIAQVLLINLYGGWSDAIHYDAMQPTVTVTPLGDIHADLSFFDTVVEPFVHAAHGATLTSAISNYPTNFENRPATARVEDLFEAEFITAWKEQGFHPLDDYRSFTDTLEDHAIEKEVAIFAIHRSELVTLCKDVPSARSLIDTLTFVPRKNWDVIPEGLKKRDRDIWRFKRKLSLLRLPIVCVDNEEDPVLLIAPGIVREAIGYIIGNYYEGTFPRNQLGPKSSMQRWFDHALAKRGSSFAVDVADELAKSGWKVETDVKVKKILQMKLARDFGDIDVLAYHEGQNRILLCECKHLHYQKTPGELAEQLSDFRGLVDDDGKRDDLRKHLDRREILMEHKDRVARYLMAKEEVALEAWVVFRNPVPMLFAWKPFEHLVRVTTFDNLSKI